MNQQNQGLYNSQYSNLNQTPNQGTFHQNPSNMGHNSHQNGNQNRPFQNSNRRYNNNQHQNNRPYNNNSQNSQTHQNNRPYNNNIQNSQTHQNNYNNNIQNSQTHQINRPYNNNRNNNSNNRNNNNNRYQNNQVQQQVRYCFKRRKCPRNLQDRCDYPHPNSDKPEGQFIMNYSQPHSKMLAKFDYKSLQSLIQDLYLIGEQSLENPNIKITPFQCSIMIPLNTKELDQYQFPSPNMEVLEVRSTILESIREKQKLLIDNKIDKTQNLIGIFQLIEWESRMPSVRLIDFYPEINTSEDQLNFLYFNRTPIYKPFLSNKEIKEENKKQEGTYLKGTFNAINSQKVSINTSTHQSKFIFEPRNSSFHNRALHQNQVYFRPYEKFNKNYAEIVNVVRDLKFLNKPFTGLISFDPQQPFRKIDPNLVFNKEVEEEEEEKEQEQQEEEEEKKEEEKKSVIKPILSDLTLGQIGEDNVVWNNLYFRSCALEYPNMRIISLVSSEDMEKYKDTYLETLIVQGHFQDWHPNSPQAFFAIDKILGEISNLEDMNKMYLKEYGIKTEEFPEKVEKYLESEEFQDRIKELQEKESNQADLTGLFTLSIDNKTTKSLDDAFSIEKIEGKDNVYKIYIHISDATAYVSEDKNDPINMEAELRKQTLYCKNLVRPMLPKIISTTLASLNKNEEKSAFTISCEIDENGIVDLSTVEIQQSKIQNNIQLTYDAVDNYIQELGVSELEKLCKDEEILKITQEKLQILKKITFSRRKMHQNLGSHFFENESMKKEIIVNEIMTLCNELIFHYNKKFYSDLNQKQQQEEEKEKEKLQDPLIIEKEQEQKNPNEQEQKEETETEQDPLVIEKENEQKDTNIQQQEEEKEEEEEENDDFFSNVEIDKVDLQVAQRQKQPLTEFFQSLGGKFDIQSRSKFQKCVADLQEIHKDNQLLLLFLTWKLTISNKYIKILIKLEQDENEIQESEENQGELNQNNNLENGNLIKNTKLVRQIDYYMSDSNLKNDKFFREKLSLREDGYMELRFITTSKKIQKMNISKEIIIEQVNSFCQNAEISKINGVFMIRKKTISQEDKTTSDPQQLQNQEEQSKQVEEEVQNDQDKPQVELKKQEDKVEQTNQVEEQKNTEEVQLEQKKQEGDDEGEKNTQEQEQQKEEEEESIFISKEDQIKQNEELMHSYSELESSNKIHFTNPLRNYGDLIAQRIIKEQISFFLFKEQVLSEENKEESIKKSILDKRLKSIKKKQRQLKTFMTKESVSHDAKLDKANRIIRLYNICRDVYKEPVIEEAIIVYLFKQHMNIWSKTVDGQDNLFVDNETHIIKESGQDFIILIEKETKKEIKIGLFDKIRIKISCKDTFPFQYDINFVELIESYKTSENINPNKVEEIKEQEQKTEELGIQDNNQEKELNE